MDNSRLKTPFDEMVEAKALFDKISAGIVQVFRERPEYADCEIFKLYDMAAMDTLRKIALYQESVDAANSDKSKSPS